MKNSSEKNTCHCADPATMIIDRYSASRILAVLLLMLFFVFAAGYFLGKRSLAHETMLDTERAAFADHVSFALNASNDHEAPVDTELHEQEDASHKIQIAELDKDFSTTATIVDAVLQYRALLFGGTKKAVAEFAQRLQKRGIAVEVCERVSKTAKGKIRYWYQAITAAYSNKDDLMTLVTTITNLEKIKNVEIISMRSTDQKGNA